MNRNLLKIVLCALVMFGPRAFPQGFVGFYNGLTTRLTTNDLQGNGGFTTGENAYRIGLYIAPAGTTDPRFFTLVGLATNASGGPLFDGRFSGGSEFPIEGNTGETIAFQVRAWSLFAGQSHEEALQYPGQQTVYVGSSAIGEVTPATGSGSSPPLFGSNPGQVPGFTLTPLIIPEPSTWALMVLGAGVLWFATRGRRRKCSPFTPKTLLITLVLLWPQAWAMAQLRVTFQNDFAHRLTTNNLQGRSGFTSGVNAYRIALYIAPQGTTNPHAFTLMGPTTVNQTGLGNGLFNGNSPGGDFVISSNTGQTIAYQVRAWSFFAGNSYEEAMRYAGPEMVYAGSSTIGEVTPSAATASPRLLFGTLPFQVRGFALTPVPDADRRRKAPE